MSWADLYRDKSDTALSQRLTLYKRCGCEDCQRRIAAVKQVQAERLRKFDVVPGTTVNLDGQHTKAHTLTEEPAMQLRKDSPSPQNTVLKPVQASATTRATVSPSMRHDVPTTPGAQPLRPAWTPENVIAASDEELAGLIDAAAEIERSGRVSLTPEERQAVAVGKAARQRMFRMVLDRPITKGAKVTR